jgi:hypothetical protein
MSQYGWPIPVLGVRKSNIPKQPFNVRIPDNPLGTIRMLFAGRALAVREVQLALSDLDNITVRIADVAARLAVLVLRLRDELRASTFP